MIILGLLAHLGQGFVANKFVKSPFYFPRLSLGEHFLVKG